MFKVTKHRLMFTEYNQPKIGVSLKPCQISKTQWKNAHEQMKMSTLRSTWYLSYTPFEIDKTP